MKAVKELVACKIPFLVAGTYAVCAYTGITRQTKDFDIFCKAGDYGRILGHFNDKGYVVEVEDERWHPFHRYGNRRKRDGPERDAAIADV